VDGGLATKTGIYEPTNVAFDALGNMYIADSLNSRIRLVTKGTGIITTVAGKGAKAYTGDGGLATSAELGLPRALAVDLAGDLYIADTANHCIRKVTKSTGYITTVAGTGVAGYDKTQQPATSAQLHSPSGVSVDAAGNIYIADTGNHRVVMVTKSTGLVSAVAGVDGKPGFDGTDGLATDHPLNNPLAVILDAAGNIIISDSGNHCVRIVTKSTGRLSIVAGVSLADYAGDDKAATEAYLSFPAGLALDAGGNLYIADSANNVIRYVTKSTGIITTVAGAGMAGFEGEGATGGNPLKAMFSSPQGVTLDGSGYLYIADTKNNRVRSVAVAASSDFLFPRAESITPSSAPTTLSPSPSPVALLTQKPSKAPTAPVPIVAKGKRLPSGFSNLIDCK
jgi:trimeric autotransporter adhesin